MDAATWTQIALAVLGIVVGLIGFVVMVSISISGWAILQTVEQGKQIASLQQQANSHSSAFSELRGDIKGVREEIQSVRSLIERSIVNSFKGESK